MTKIINLEEHRNNINKDLPLESEQLDVEKNLAEAKIVILKDGFQITFDAINDGNKIFMLGLLDILKASIMHDLNLDGQIIHNDG